MDQIEGPWTPEEDKIMQNLAAVFGMDWSLISKSLPGRTVKSCWSRWRSLSQTFTPEEDEMLENLVQEHGMNWSLISKSMPGKSGMACWSRWISLCQTFTPEEDEMLENLVQEHGLNWSLISKSMPGKSGMACKTRWSLLTSKGISLGLKRKSCSMTDEDETIDAHKIPPQSFSNIGITQGSSYIHDLHLSHEVGGVSGKAPSIGDMARCNMSSGSVHSFTHYKSAPSWNALNKRDPSLLMIESDKLQEFPSDEFEPMMTESDNVPESAVQFSLVRTMVTTDD